MKKNLLLALAVVFALGANAQEVGKIWSHPNMTWFGADFTLAKVIGLEDSPHKIRDEYFKAWNDVTIEMDMAKMFEKKAVYKDNMAITKQNLARETETLNKPAEKELTEETVAARVKEMPTGTKKDGLGLVFIVQSVDKTAAQEVVFVTFFDIATRKVLWVKKMTGKLSGKDPKGLGGTGIKDIFSQIEKKEFKAWRKEANY
ncbi:MAG: hypothetical protein KA149_12480 [Chitinophagales bacterium]|nr:hypothetical protein [Chitinophagales bacterium]